MISRSPATAEHSLVIRAAPKAGRVRRADLRVRVPEVQADLRVHAVPERRAQEEVRALRREARQADLVDGVHPQGRRLVQGPVRVAPAGAPGRGRGGERGERAGAKGERGEKGEAKADKAGEKPAAAKPAAERPAK